MRCANCDAELPEAGKFCIECGAPAQPGRHRRDRAPARSPGGPRCASLWHTQPTGRSLLRALRSRARRTRRSPSRPQSAAAQPTPAPRQSPSAGRSADSCPSGQAATRSTSAWWGGISGGLFLIGIAAAGLVTGWWWPGILVLVGIIGAGQRAASRAQLGSSAGAASRARSGLFGLALIAGFELVVAGHPGAGWPERDPWRGVLRPKQARPKC